MNMKEMKFVFLTSLIMLAGVANLSAALAYSPPTPRTGETVTFTLSPSGAPVGAISWNFGDGTPVQSGSLTITHAYAAVRSYKASASYIKLNSAIPQVDQATVTVIDPRQVTFSPPQPKAGQAIVFTAQNFFSSCIRWDFGDATIKNGIASESHAYAAAGSYTVHAYEECGATYGAAVTLTVAEKEVTPPPITPTKPTLAVAFLNLYFAGGKAEASVAKDFAGLQAFADIQVEGTGILQWQWLVDGMAIKTDSMAAGLAGKFTLDSGQVPGLPTTVPGRHQVTLRFQNPKTDFTIPVITYFVGLRGPAPVVSRVTPQTLAPGKEYNLELEGVDLTAGTEISFPTSIAVVKKPVIRSSRQAQVTVFVAPNAAAGTKVVTARNEYGTSEGPGQVMIGSPGGDRLGPNPPPTTPRPQPAKIPRIMGLMDCYPDASPPYVDARVQLVRGENPNVQAVTGAVVKVDGMDLPEESPTSPTYEARLNMDLPVGHQFTVSVTVDGITYTGKGGQIDNFFRWAQPTAGTRIDQSKPDINFQWTFNNGVAPVHFMVQYVGPLSPTGYPLFQIDVNSDHYVVSTSLIPPSMYPYYLNVYLTKTYAPILFEGIDASWAQIPVCQGFLQRQTWLTGGPIIVKPFPSSAAELIKILAEAKKQNEPPWAQSGAPIPGSIMETTRPSITGWIDCFPSRVPPSADVWGSVRINSNWVEDKVVKVDGHVTSLALGPGDANAKDLDFSPGHRFSVSVTINGITYTGTSGPIDTVAILDHPRDGDTISLSQKKWLGIGWSFSGAPVPMRLGVKYCPENSGSCIHLLPLQMVNGNGLTLSLAEIPRGQGGRIIIFLGRDLGPIVWDSPDRLSPDSIFSVGQSWNFATVILKVVD
jgi:hypothetical protein